MAVTGVDYKKLIQNEYIRCAKDPAYFMRKYVMIQHPVRGRILFDLYPFQEDLLHLFRDSENIIVLKSRQLGISTLGAGYSLWLMLFHRDKNVLCLATTQATARNLVTKVIFAYENLPKWMQVPATQKNKLSLRLSNGSMIQAVSSNPESARSNAISLLLVDECAFIENIETTMAAAMPTLSTGGQVMLLSTPNGIGNYYHKTWVNAEMGINSFVPVKLRWDVHPERDQKWRDQQDADLGKRTAAQECVSGDTLVQLRNSLSTEEFKLSIRELYEEVGSNVQNCPYKILTPTGYQSFYGIRKVHKEFYYRVEFEDGTELKASDNHRVALEDGTLCEVSKLIVGQVVTGDRKLQVKLVQRIGEPIDLYDALEVGNGHLYLTNGIVSKNCDCNFLTSGNTFFETEDMAFYEETYQQEPVEKRGIGSEYWIWEYPDYTRSYLVSADVARGDGGDFSTAVVWDIESCTQVAEYQGQMSPKDFGAFLCSVATEYNNALLSVENASIGWATVEEVLARNYPNLYYSPSGNQDSVESYMHKSETGKLVPGFTNSPRTRPLMLSSFFDYIHTRSVTIKSKRLMLEMRTFVWGTNGKAAASNGCHDDLVLAAGQGLYIRDTALKLRQQGLDLMRASMSAFTSLNRRESPVVQTTFDRANGNPYVMQDQLGNQQDISWVLG